MLCASPVAKYLKVCPHVPAFVKLCMIQVLGKTKNAKCNIFYFTEGCT